jgi:hypothetical protein
MLSLKVKKGDEIKFAQCKIFEARRLLKDIRNQGYEVLRINYV